MKNILMENENYKISIKNNKLVILDKEYDETKSYSLKQSKNKKNVLLELAEELNEINKNFKNIKALNIKLRSNIAENTYLTGHIMYGKGEYTSLKEVIKSLSNWYYDDKYGIQELEGIILFDDNTWLEREEYDGSEWWEYRQPPTVKEILEWER